MRTNLLLVLMRATCFFALENRSEQRALYYKDTSAASQHPDQSSLRAAWHDAKTTTNQVHYTNMCSCNNTRWAADKCTRTHTLAHMAAISVAAVLCTCCGEATTEGRRSLGLCHAVEWPSTHRGFSNIYTNNCELIQHRPLHFFLLFLQPTVLTFL